MADFDPYYQWLGIPPKDQPPNHYRLLGLERFEPDLGVIENAADRQMAHVRTFQSGPHGADSQKLLNEISAAKVCLLSAAKKAEYDERLRSTLAAVSAPPLPPPANVPPVAPPEPAARQVRGGTAAPRANRMPPAASRSGSEDSVETDALAALAAVATPSRTIQAAELAGGEQASAGRNRMLLFGAIAVAVIGIAALVWALTRNGDGGNDSSSNQLANHADPGGHNGASGQNGDGTSSENGHTGEDANSGTQGTQPKNANGGQTEPHETTKPSEDDDDNESKNPPITPDNEDVSATDPDEGVQTSGQELVEPIDADTSEVEVVLAPPDQPPAGAVVELNNLVLSALAHPETPKFLEGAMTAWFENQPKRAEIKFGVLDFTVKQSGMVFLVTTTEPQGSEEPAWTKDRLTKQDLLALGWQDYGACPWKPSESLLGRQVSTGERYQIRMNKYWPPSLVLPAPAGSVAPLDVPLLGPPLNVLARVDEKRDTLRGEFSTLSGALAAVKEGRIVLPISAPAEYRLTLVIERSPGLERDRTNGILFVSGEQRFVALWDSASGAGFHNLDNKPWNRNETTYRGPLFEAERKSTAVFTIRNSGVSLEVDGKSLINFRGDLARFSSKGIDKNWEASDKTKLVLGCGPNYRFHQITLQPVLDRSNTPAHEMGQPVDLLAALDLVAAGAKGEWSRDGQSLLAPPNGLLLLPGEAPQEYQLAIEGEILPGPALGRELGVCLAAGDRQFAAVIDGAGESESVSEEASPTAGLQMLDGNSWKENEATYFGRPLAAGKRFSLVYVVSNLGASVAIDGNTVVDYRGGFSRLSLKDLEQTWAAVDEGRLALSTAARCRLHKIELTPILPWSPAAAEGNAVDLLKDVELPADGVQVGWRKVGDSLTTSDSAQYALLRLKGTLPSEYDLSLRVMRGMSRRDSPGLALILPGPEGPFMAYLEGERGKGGGGLQMLDGAQWFENETTYQGAKTKLRNPVEVVARVRREGVLIEINGQPAIRWRGDFRRLALGDAKRVWNAADPDRMYLGASGTWQVSKIELRKVSP